MLKTNYSNRTRDHLPLSKELEGRDTEKEWRISNWLSLFSARRASFSLDMSIP